MTRSFAREQCPFVVYSTYLMPKANFPGLVTTSAVTVPMCPQGTLLVNSYNSDKLN